MLRFSLILLMFILPSASLLGMKGSIIVADSLTHIPLPNASVYDRNGKPVALTDRKGRIPVIDGAHFPLSIRYLGYNDRIVPFTSADTVFMQESVSELPEIVFESQGNRILHLLAYVRDYSVMSTYTDTVFMFREKMVDFMLSPEKNIKFKGWTIPRVLTSKSYYRFTNSNGLDSVSDSSNHHFSWSDWIGVSPSIKLPDLLRQNETATDTFHGKYGPAEMWLRDGDKVKIDINVLADKVTRKWVPNFDAFFRDEVDFEYFKLHLNYSNVVEDSITPLDLAAFSFDIESNGRGHSMFRFNRRDESFYVSTHADVFVLDKEFITLKEAKKWENRKFDIEQIGIFEPTDAPDLDRPVQDLILRVDGIDIDRTRLKEIRPDYRLISRHSGAENMKTGNRALAMLRHLTGISAYRHKRNMNRRWNSFRDKQKRRKRAE